MNNRKSGNEQPFFEKLDLNRESERGAEAEKIDDDLSDQNDLSASLLDEDFQCSANRTLIEKNYKDFSLKNAMICEDFGASQQSLAAN